MLEAKLGLKKSCMRILVVDDEKIKRITLADDLATQGHEVVSAGEGAEALRKLDQQQFDVVVTDLKMPGIDGLELLRRIKQGPPTDIQVIMMTAYGSIPVAVEAVKLVLTISSPNHFAMRIFSHCSPGSNASGAPPLRQPSRPAGRPPISTWRSSAARNRSPASSAWSKSAREPAPTCFYAARRVWART